MPADDFAIRRLVSADAASFRALRLRGLVEVPSAFGSSFEEERDRTVEAVAERIATNTSGFILGAFAAGAFAAGAFDARDTLVGVVGIQRERAIKRAHKAILWGMYVAPETRGRGVGRRLVAEALEQAFEMPGLRQVLLGVNATNAAAKALYEGAGFTSFGVEPGCMIVDGLLHDEVHMICVRPGA